MKRITSSPGKPREALAKKIPRRFRLSARLPGMGEIIEF
jgi:hypothetical protein